MEALKACKAPIYKAYLVCRLEHSRVKKESSAITYWKVLSMWYAQETQSYMNESVLYDMRNVRGLYQSLAVTLTPHSGFLQY
jgi:hypothetical protein